MVGAIDSGHLNVAVGGIVAQARADADGVDGHAGLSRPHQRIARRVVDAVGKEHNGGDLVGGELPRCRRHRPRDRGGLSGRRQTGQAPRSVQRVGLLGKRDNPHAEIAFELFAPFRQLLACLLETRRAGGVVGDAHRGRRVEQEDQCRPLGRRVLVAQAPAETGASRPAEWPPLAGRAASRTARAAAIRTSDDRTPRPAGSLRRRPPPSLQRSDLGRV